MHKIRNDDSYVALQGHCIRHAHNETTRNNNTLVSLLKINTKYTFQGFFYMGAKLYNALNVLELPKKGRTLWKTGLLFENEITWSLNIGLLIVSSMFLIYILVLKL